MYNRPDMEIEPTQPLRIRPGWHKTAKIILAALAVIVTVVWLSYTPPGLLGKADAIGYAVCHRISARSFFLADRQVPLCARCSGMYIGMLLGILYQLPFGRRGKMPPLRITIPLTVFLLAFGVDGVNSYLHFFPSAPSLYQPANWLRLATGVGLGILVSVIILPVFHQTFWRAYEDRALLERWGQVLPLLVLSLLTGLAMYSQNPLFLYPLAVLSAFTIPLILTLCYGLLWMLLIHRENGYSSLREGWVPLLAGYVTAMLQIGLIDLARFALTGTWAGFSL